MDVQYFEYFLRFQFDDFGEKLFTHHEQENDVVEVGEICSLLHEEVHEFIFVLELKSHFLALPDDG